MKERSKEQILQGKIYAVLAYLSILCIIPLVVKRENDFALFHAKQGLIIFLGQVAVFIVALILGNGFLRLGLFIFGIISFLGILAALKGQYLSMPIIADIAEKIIL